MGHNVQYGCSPVPVRRGSCACFYLSILNPVPTLIMIVLESFVMVGAGHESQHQAAPRGEEKLTKVATDEYSGHQARVTTLSHGTDTANIFSPMCLVTGRGAHGGERGESILRITNLRRDDEEDDDPSRGARHKHSPPSRPGTEFQMSSATATRID